MPQNYFYNKRKLKFSDIFHFRAPINWSFYYTFCYSPVREVGLNMQATGTKSQPISYLIQKFFLKKQNLFPVTINGF